eukprot:11341146-Alexandrium_andersonii.AAC.1
MPEQELQAGANQSDRGGWPQHAQIGAREGTVVSTARALVGRMGEQVCLRSVPEQHARARARGH